MPHGDLVHNPLFHRTDLVANHVFSGANWYAFAMDTDVLHGLPHRGRVGKDYALGQVGLVSSALVKACNELQNRDELVQTLCRNVPIIEECAKFDFKMAVLKGTKEGGDV